MPPIHLVKVNPSGQSQPGQTDNGQTLVKLIPWPAAVPPFQAPQAAMLPIPPQIPLRVHLSAAAEHCPARHGNGKQKNGFRVSFSHFSNLLLVALIGIILLLQCMVLQGRVLRAEWQAAKGCEVKVCTQPSLGIRSAAAAVGCPARKTNTAQVNTEICQHRRWLHDTPPYSPPQEHHCAVSERGSARHDKDEQAKCFVVELYATPPQMSLPGHQGAVLQGITRGHSFIQHCR